MSIEERHMHFNSMHKARLMLRTRVKEEIKTKGKMTHNEMLRYLMVYGLLCRQVAESYIQDMLFVGELNEKNDIITIPQPKPENR